MAKQSSHEKKDSKGPRPKSKKPEVKALTLFEMMRVLSAAQRQEFGRLRRKWKAKAGVQEKIEHDGKEWVVRYYKEKQKLAEAKFFPLSLYFKEF